MSQRLADATTFSVAQEEVLGQLIGLATQLAVDASENNVPVATQLEMLGRFDERAQTSLGNMLRLRAGGDIEIELPTDPVEGPLAALLRDAFPLMLVPAELTFFPQLHLSAALWSNPHREAFEEGVLNDPDLSRLFVEHTDNGGWSSMVYRSTG